MSPIADRLADLLGRRVLLIVRGAGVDVRLVGILEEGDVALAWRVSPLDNPVTCARFAAEKVTDVRLAACRIEVRA